MSAPVTATQPEWGPTRRIERCACGGLVVANPLDLGAVMFAVRSHRLTPTHQEWLLMGGLDPVPLIWETIARPRQRAL